jgi:hypothetical protein
VCALRLRVTATAEVERPAVEVFRAFVCLASPDLIVPSLGIRSWNGHGDGHLENRAVTQRLGLPLSVAAYCRSLPGIGRLRRVPPGLLQPASGQLSIGKVHGALLICRIDRRHHARRTYYVHMPIAQLILRQHGADMEFFAHPVGRYVTLSSG